jgi:hypothetical protein
MVSGVEMFAFHNGKMIPSCEYHKLRMLEILSTDGTLLLGWLKKRNKSAVSMVEIYKCVVPTSLRNVKTIRVLLEELTKLGFTQKTSEFVVYSGRKRKESWKLTII